MDGELSAKKSIELGIEEKPQSVDPVCLGHITAQVCDLLRFHQSIGIRSYPQKERLRALFLPQRSSTGGTRKKTAVPEARKGSVKPKRSLVGVRQDIGDCEQCMKKTDRAGQIFGRGPVHPRLMVVGDWIRNNESVLSEEMLFGPEEDDMLRRMIEAIKLSMDEVYICNVIKCISVGVQPDKDCGRRCFLHLKQEIAVINPGLILAMGEMAAGLLTGSSSPLVRLRGRFYPYAGARNSAIRIMPTFHPRFLLQHSEMKPMVWQDLQMLQRQLNR